MRTSLILLAALLAASHLPVAAQSKPVRPSTGKLLSRTELRTCIQREEELGTRQDALRQAHDAQQLSSAKLSAEAIELSRMLRAIGPNDDGAVDRYNRRNEARNAEVDSHNKRAEALNAANGELQEAEADFLATCASRPFLKADETAVLKELNLKERRYERERRQPPVREVEKSSA